MIQSVEGSAHVAQLKSKFALSIGMLQLSQLYRKPSFTSCLSAVPRTWFRRAMSAPSARSDPFRPAKRVAGQKQDVWYARPDVSDTD